MPLPEVLACFTFAAAIMVGILVLRNKTESSPRRLCFLLCLALALWSMTALSFAHARTLPHMRALFRSSVVLAGLNAALMLHFTLRLTEPSKQKWGDYPWLLYLPTAAIILVALRSGSYLQGFSRTGDTWVYWPPYSSPALIVFAVYWIAYYGLSLALFFARSRRDQNLEVRRHCRILFWSLLVSAVLIASKTLLFPALIDVPIHGAAPSFKLVWLVAVAVVMDRDRFLLGRLKAERQALREIPELPLVTTDTRGRVIALNREAEELFDTYQHRMAGRCVGNLIKSTSAISSVLERLGDGEAPPATCDLEIARSDDSRVAVTAQISRLCDNWSRHVGYLLVFRQRMAVPEVRSRFRLSRREADVLLCLVDGCTNREIAEQLYVSERTVKTHVTHIFQKLGVGNRTRAISLLREHRVLTNDRFLKATGADSV